MVVGRPDVFPVQEAEVEGVLPHALVLDPGPGVSQDNPHPIEWPALVPRKGVVLCQARCAHNSKFNLVLIIRNQSYKQAV